VSLSGEQAAKTQTTLEFFAGRLDAGSERTAANDRAR
jgi:hypothetical protein